MIPKSKCVCSIFLYFSMPFNVAQFLIFDCKSNTDMNWLKCSHCFMIRFTSKLCPFYSIADNLSIKNNNLSKVDRFCTRCLEILNNPYCLCKPSNYTTDVLKYAAAKTTSFHQPFSKAVKSVRWATDSQLMYRER